MAFWNEPTAPAWYGQQFQLHSPGLSPSLYKPKKTTAELLIEAAGKIGGTLTQQMQKRKQDAIAQSLLEQEASPEDLARYSKAGLQGVAAYSQWNDDKQGEEKDVDQWYKRALEQQRLDAGNDSTAAPDDVTQRYKEAQIAHLNRMGTGQSNAWANAIPLRRGTLITPEMKTKNPNLTGAPGEFTNQYSGADNGDYVVLQFPTGKTATVPFAEFQSRRQSATQPMQDNGELTDAGAVEPDTLPQAATAPQKPEDRVAGQVYQTPRGSLKWTGTGWIAP